MKRISDTTFLFMIYTFLAGVALFFLLQTYNKAYRDFGYDFTLFLQAAQMIYAGEDPRDIIWPYLYVMPTLLIPFLFIPKAPAVFLWFCLNVGALALIFRVSFVFLKRSGYDLSQTKQWGAAVLVIVLLIPILQNDFLNGQINLIILGCTLLSVLFAIENRNGRAAFFLALAVMLKITPALFLFFFLIRKRWKLLGFAMVWMAVLAGIPFLFLGLHNFGFYLDYLHHILNERLTYRFDITHSIFLSFEDALSHFLNDKPSFAWLWGGEWDLAAGFVEL